MWTQRPDLAAASFKREVLKLAGFDPMRLVSISYQKEPTTMPSRREFLIRCVQLAVAARGGIGALAQLQSAEPSAGFSREELKLLGAAMDEVIPQSDRMPSASAAGGVAYVQQLGWQYDNISKDIGAFLHVLQKACEEEFGIGFADLESQRRIVLMKSIEESSAKLFSDFVAYVYEAYYTRPQVQGLLSCSIPPVPDDNDELLLAPVRKLAPLYRKCREE
jgi:hypothetical protein